MDTKGSESSEYQNCPEEVPLIPSFSTQVNGLQKVFKS
jgi:hypothetical protein